MGKLLTAEHCAAISRSQRRRFQGPNQFAVQCRDFEGNTFYDTQTEVVLAFKQWVKDGCHGHFRVRQVKRKPDNA